MGAPVPRASRHWYGERARTSTRGRRAGVRKADDALRGPNWADRVRPCCEEVVPSRFSGIRHPGGPTPRPASAARCRTADTRARTGPALRAVAGPPRIPGAVLTATAAQTPRRD